MHALPMRAVHIRDQIPKPIFKQVFSHYATYADLESDLVKKLADGIQHTNRWLCYLTRICQTQQQFLELFVVAQDLVREHGYVEGLQTYIFLN